MRQTILFFIFLLTVSSLLTGCGSFSTDPAPGGISNPHIGMDAQSAARWQDQTMRNLAY